LGGIQLRSDRGRNGLQIVSYRGTFERAPHFLDTSPHLRSNLRASLASALKGQHGKLLFNALAADSERGSRPQAMQGVTEQAAAFLPQFHSGFGEGRSVTWKRDVFVA
jgi:hypothetical protein